MRVLKHFEYRDNNILTAAQIGVSKWRWDFADENWDLDQAKHFMKTKEYDVLPIVNNDDSFSSYYTTRKWGDYEDLKKNKIDDSNKIYYKMSFIDLVKKFTEETYSRYFFLETHDEVVGLISTVNFNTLPVYNYLYREIADIEYRVSGLLEENVSQEVILETLLRSSDKMNNDLANKFIALSQTNEGSNIFQHLYLPNLGYLIRKHVEDLPIEKRAIVQYASSFFKEYRKLRNIVAHPIRHVISSKDSFEELSKTLDDFEDIRNLIQ